MNKIVTTLYCIAIGTIILSFARLFFGVDFTDESYFIAVIYRFILGDKPFVDELNLTQSAALIVYPFFKAYYLLFKTEGFVLFGRFLFFIFYCYVASIIYWAIKDELSQLTSFLIACSALLFVPLNIPNVSYNSLGCGLLIIGAFLLLKELQSKKQSLVLLSGIHFGLATLSYPPLFLSAILFFLSYLFFARKNQAFLKTILFFTPILIIGCVFLYKVGMTNFLTTLSYTKGTGGNFTKAISAFWNLFVIWSPNKFLLLFYFIVFHFLIRKLPFLMTLSLCLSPLLFTVRMGYWSSSCYVASLSFLSLFMFYFSDTKSKKLFLLIWIPSLLSSLITSWTSTNWTINAGIGFFPGFIVTLIMLVRLIEHSYSKKFLSALPCLLVLFIFLNYERHVFGDDGVFKLRTQIKEGPFLGLLTSQEKSQFLLQLSKHLKSLENKNGKIVFFEHFPAGYLLTSMKPLTSSVWKCYSLQGKTCKDDYKKNFSTDNIAVEMSAFLRDSSHIEKTGVFESELDKFISEQHKLIVSNSYYKIYSLKKD